MGNTHSACERRFILQGVALFASPFPASCVWAQDGKIGIVTEEWAPYNYTENGMLKGFSVEIVRSIIQRLNGGNIPIQLFPSMRAGQMVRTQPGTMMITMFRTPEREAQFKWIGPLDTGAIYLYKKKGNPLRVASLEDAKKVKRIACRHGGVVLDTLRAAGFNNLDASSTDGASVYKKLLLGRCDLGISDTPLGVKYLLKQMGAPTDAVQPTVVKIIESPLYIACSKDIPDQTIALWQRELDEMKTTGLYAKIHAKYNA